MSVFETQALLASARVRREDFDRVVASGLLQPRHYLEVVEERVTAGRCGFPLCPQSITRGSVSPGQLELDPVSGEFVGRREVEFCCRECGRQSTALLRLIESSAHFGGAETSSSSVEDLLRAMGAEVDEDSVTETELPPPKFSNSRLTTTGEVIASEERRPDGVSRPKRLRQLRKKVLEDSSAVSSSGLVVGSADPQVLLTDDRHGAGDMPSGLHASGVNLTFAALNYASLVAPLSQGKRADSRDDFADTKARPTVASTKRGAKVVTWSDDVKASAASGGAKASASKAKAAKAESASSKPSIVGTVIERTSAATPLPQLSGSNAGGGIEGYETRVQRLSGAEDKGREDSGAADSDTDSDSPSLDDSGFPLDSDDHYASLNLFAVLWLVSDDIFGDLLPLSMTLGPLDAGNADDRPESDPPSFLLELNKGERHAHLGFYLI